MSSNRVEFSPSSQIPNIHSVVITSCGYVVAERESRVGRREKGKREGREKKMNKYSLMHSVKHSDRTLRKLSLTWKCSLLKFYYSPSSSETNLKVRIINSGTHGKESFYMNAIFVW